MKRLTAGVILGVLSFALPSDVLGQSGAIQARQGWVSPAIPSTRGSSATPPAPTESERQRRRRVLQRMNIRLPMPEGAVSGAARAVSAEGPLPLMNAVTSALPSDLVVSRFSALGAAAPPGFKTTVGEPTASGYGNILIQTGNWYIAVSRDAGASWTFLNPFDQMAGVDDGFCCDQVARYDPSRDLLLVSVLSVPSTVTNRNTLRLFVVQGVRSACCALFAYDFTPQAIGLPAGQWHDYPKMTVGKNFLYLTTNRFAPVTCPPCAFQGSTVYRLPLDALKTGAPLSFLFATLTEGSPLMAEGIANSDTAYWGSNLSTSTLRVFTWAESSGTVFFHDVPVAPWSDADRVCPGPDGRDFTSRADGRLQFAVLSDRNDGVDGKQLLFGQSSAAQPASRPFAYIRMTRVAVASMAALDTRDIAFSNTCAVYAAGSVNARGGLAVSAFIGGGAMPPSHVVGLWDEFGGTGAFPFQVAMTQPSTQGPAIDAWGDYLSVDPLFPITCAFQTAAYVLANGGADDDVQPFFLSFGRSLCFP